MNTEELFIDANNLPKTLPKDQVNVLLDKIKHGDEEAIKIMVEHNIRLVLKEVTVRFKSVAYDKKDLVSIGNLGLIKAVETFDKSKNVAFSSYATRCIDNEILMFLRKLKKNQSCDSLDETIVCDMDGKELKLGDTISDKRDIVEEYEKKETYQIIREIVKELPDRDRKIIMLQFGFYNNKIYNQDEIADITSISQPHVSRLTKRILKRIGEQLIQKGVIELKTNQQSQSKQKGKKVKMARELKSIYKYFNDFTKEQVDAMLEKLSEEERLLIVARYGEDLNNPVPGKLSKKQTKRFYGSLVPKMKRLLSISSRMGELKIKAVENISSNEEIKQEKSTAETLSKNCSYSDELKVENTSIKREKEEMTKDDCIKILELLRTKTFSQMINLLTFKEAVIISLKLGYIDGKYFSNESIANFLGIEQDEVIETSKKILLLNKENISELIDHATIEIVTDHPLKLTKKNTKC